jgi:hypothetical protein
MDIARILSKMLKNSSKTKLSNMRIWKTTRTRMTAATPRSPMKVNPRRRVCLCRRRVRRMYVHCVVSSVRKRRVRRMLYVHCVVSSVLGKIPRVQRRKKVKSTKKVKANAGFLVRKNAYLYYYSDYIM